MRVTHQTTTTYALQRLQSRLGQLQKSQEQLASGTRIGKPSDDPAAMNKLLTLRSDEASADQAARNASDGLQRTSIADSHLRTLIDRLHRARELAIRAANTSAPSERNAIATEIRTIGEEAAAIANGNSGGRGLFSGHSDGPAVQQVAGVWTYTGDGGQVRRRVGEGDVVTVNVTGDDVFGFAAGRDVFSVLDDLADRIVTADAAGVQTSIAEVDTSMTNILDGLAKLGAATNRIEAGQIRTDDTRLAVQSEISKVESVDIAEAITDLQLHQVAFEATLGALSRSLQPSLTQFLR
ncbi:MAG: flagellar hook-associated protein FlgL [Acidimicrobiia bacterium]